MLNNVVRSVLRCMTSRLSYSGSKVEIPGTPSEILDLRQLFLKNMFRKLFPTGCNLFRPFFYFPGVTFKKNRKYPVFKCGEKNLVNNDCGGFDYDEQRGEVSFAMYDLPA